MTSERKTVDDAALIAEARNNCYDRIGVATEDELILEVLRLERTGWQPHAPEPDRAEALAEELWGTPWEAPKFARVIRRHFDELRAEWEAERPVIDVPEDILWICKNGASVSRAHPSSHEGMMRDFILSRVRRAE